MATDRGDKQTIMHLERRCDFYSQRIESLETQVKTLHLQYAWLSARLSELEAAPTITIQHDRKEDNE